MSSALSELSASHDAVDDGSEDKFPLCNDRAEALARSFVASIPGMVDSDEDAPGLGLQRKSRMSTRATLPKAALRLAVQLDAANVREARRAVVDALLVRVDALRGKQGALLAELRDAAAAETARTGRAASPLIVPLLAEENDTTLDACDDALDAALVARIQELQVARARLGKWAEKRDDAEGGTSRLASSASLSRDVVARSTSSRLPRPRTQPRDTSATNVPVDAPSPRPLRSENISQRTLSRIDMHKRLHRTKSMLRISRIEERIGQSELDVKAALLMLRMQNTLHAVAETAERVEALERAERTRARPQHGDAAREEEHEPAQFDSRTAPTGTERSAEIERLRALVDTQGQQIDALRRGGSSASDAGAPAAEVEGAGVAAAGGVAATEAEAAAAMVPRKVNARPSRSAMRATEWAAGFVDGRYRGNAAPMRTITPYVFGAAPPEPPHFEKQ